MDDKKNEQGKPEIEFDINDPPPIPSEFIDFLVERLFELREEKKP